MASIHTTTYECDWCKTRANTTEVVRNKIEFRNYNGLDMLWEVCDECAKSGWSAIYDARQGKAPK